MFSLARLRNIALDLLFPPKPLVRELLRMDASEFLSRAGKPSGYAGKNIISVASYTDPLVRQAVWELKYRGNKKIAALLAGALHDELVGFLEEFAPLTNFTDPLIIPVPLSPKRERERGFNQCELLCNELMRLDSPFVKGEKRILACPPIGGQAFQGGDERGGISPSNGSTAVFGRRGVAPSKGSTAVFGRRGVIGRNFTLSTSALRKIKDTPSQTKADSRAKRLENLMDCFLADPQEVNGRNIILIDDVATTGATLAEARRALRAAHARKVIAFTIAH